ncbi:MAG: holo-ACP synthase [Armatimonadetes bacterium]|nr:holo-ACP synthase [Armatimonadota bacterium]
MIAGVGVDMIEVARIERAVAHWGDRFLRRLFTPAEVARAGPGSLRPQRLAARFAAKAAVMTALGLGGRAMAWREIEVLNDTLGRPHVVLHGSADRIARQQGVAAVMVSLTHTSHVAIAQAVAVRHAGTRASPLTLPSPLNPLKYPGGSDDQTD